MKDKKEDILKNFKYKLFIRIILVVLLSAAIVYFILTFIADGILNDFLARKISNIDSGLYRFFLTNKSKMVLVLFAFVVIGAVYYTLSKVVKYMRQIVDCIDIVFQKDENFIHHLPKDFEEIENKLNEIKRTSIQNEKMAKEAEQRKNDLIIYMAHDLKTPLTSVVGYLTLLKEENKISEELRDKYLGISLDKAQRLEDLINEFFEITRFNLQGMNLAKTNVNLSIMLNQLIEEFYPLIKEKELQYILNIDEDMYIDVDSDKLARVFDNLLRNAINYSYPNTELEIEAINNVTHVILKFRNTGEKIPENQLKNIFEKFYRLDTARSSKTGGAGLGLAIAKEIVKAHGGAITANSNEEYTEFVIELKK